jgi:hypothetical protein
MVTEIKRAGRRRGGNGKTAAIRPAAFKLNETLAYLGGVSAPTVYRWVERGLLHPNKHLRGLLFSRVELDQFLAQTRSKRWKRKAAG